MLRITAEVRDHMFAHALAMRPNEACGMFSAPDSSDVVDQFHPVANAAESPTVFVLDAQQMLDVESMLDETGRSLIGVMHSHTATSAYPSATDVRDSATFDPAGSFRQVIVSLRHGEPSMRCFQIRELEIVEIPIVVDDGTLDTGDDEDTVAMAAVMRLAPPRS